MTRNRAKIVTAQRALVNLLPYSEQGNRELSE